MYMLLTYITPFFDTCLSQVAQGVFSRTFGEAEVGLEPQLTALLKEEQEEPCSIRLIGMF